MFLRDSVGLTCFLLISLSKKNGMGCPCEYRLYGREHVIDLASSVERSIHCVWPRACLDGVLSKKSEGKAKSASTLIFQFQWCLDAYLDGTDECEGREDMICFHVSRHYDGTLPLDLIGVRSFSFISIFSSPFSHMRCISSPSVSPRCHSNSFLEKRGRDSARASLGGGRRS